MRKFNFVRTSPITRAASFLIVFILATIAAEIFIYASDSGSIIPGIVIIFSSIVVGTTLISERYTVSRMVAASTLLVLSTIALKFGHTPMPSILLLILVIVVSYFGALPIFHKKQRTTQQAIIYSVLAAVIGIISTVLFTYISTVLTRIAVG